MNINQFIERRIESWENQNAILHHDIYLRDRIIDELKLIQNELNREKDNDLL